MKKRTFIKNSSLLIAGSSLVPSIISCQNRKDADTASVEMSSSGDFVLPPLSYGFADLEPHIDAMTMEIHHDRHHAGYVKNLNSALENSPLKGISLEEMMSKLTEQDTAIRNNGGGHYNHSLYWNILSPKGGGQATGDLGDAINAAFDSFEQFKTLFSKAAATRFGSGWAWLCQDASGKLFISSTANQDNPLMTNIVAEVGTPLLGIDVWEHAYYLKYQNKRADYIENFFNVIDWNVVGARLK